MRRSTLAIATLAVCLATSWPLEAPARTPPGRIRQKIRAIHQGCVRYAMVPGSATILLGLAASGALYATGHDVAGGIMGLAVPTVGARLNFLLMAAPMQADYRRATGTRFARFRKMLAAHSDHAGVQLWTLGVRYLAAGEILSRVDTAPLVELLRATPKLAWLAPLVDGGRLVAATTATNLGWLSTATGVGLHVAPRVVRALRGPRPAEPANTAVAGDAVVDR